MGYHSPVVTAGSRSSSSEIKCRGGGGWRSRLECSVGSKGGLDEGASSRATLEKRARGGGGPSFRSVSKEGSCSRQVPCDRGPENHDVDDHFNFLQRAKHVIRTMQGAQWRSPGEFPHVASL